MEWLLRGKQKNYSPEFPKINKLHKIKSIVKCTTTKFSIFYVLFLYLCFIQVLPSKTKDNFYFKVFSYFGSITIKISGKGQQAIIGENYPYCPDFVYLGETLLYTKTIENDNNCQTISITSSTTTKTLILKWNIHVDSLQGIFADLTNLLEVDFSQYDSSTILHMTDMFYGCVSLESVNFNNINTTLVEDMTSMFANCSSLLELDLSSFDTSKITNMSFIFYGCSNLLSLNIKSFDTSNVIDMNSMFYQLSSLEELEIDNFNTANVKDMSYMFYECNKLKSVDFTRFDTSSVTNMYAMFYRCYQIESLNLINFNTAQVTNMRYMFAGCRSMTSLDISKFDTSNVDQMDYIFFDCFSLSSLEISSFDTSKVTNMECMFCNCYNLTTLNVSHFNTEKVTNMDSMFYDCEKLTSLDLTNFKTDNVENLSYMFSYCYALLSLNLSNFDTSKVTSISGMFHSCESLTSLDISNFNTEQVTNMEETFYNCQNLFFLDISNFKTDHVNYMINMFAFCSNLTSLDLMNFNTEQVSDMNAMFDSCEKLKYLNIKNFKTELVGNMAEMFKNCKSLTSLDLSGFDTNFVGSMNSMFSGCENLIELNLSNFSFNHISNMEKMFSNCTHLEYINLLLYEESVAELLIDNILELVPENIVICLDNEKEIQNLETLINSRQCSIIYCGEDWKSQQKKLIAENNTCIDNCTNFIYESDNKCYSTCPEGAECLQETTSIYTTNKLIETTSNIDTTTKNVDSTINNQEENVISTDINPSSSNTYINTILYATSFHTENNINNKNSDTISKILSSSYILTSFSSSNIISSTLNQNISNNNEESSNIINFITDSEIVINNEGIYQDIINDKMQNFNVSENKELIVEGKDDFFYHITTSDNEKDSLDGTNNSTNKFSKIDLGECEYLLKDHYHINRNTSLIIVKFEKITNVSMERSLQYEVYEPYNKTKLDLSICQNTTIDVYVPVVLSEELHNLYNELKEKGYDLFDENSNFYNDICTPFESPNGTDVSLSDRYNYYFNNNETVCQSNCKFSDYSLESQYLKCECDVSNTEIDTQEVKKFTPNTLYESFYETLKFSNYKVLKCYNLVFNKNVLLRNKGSIIAIIYFILYLLFLCIYSFKGINKLKIELAKQILNHPNNDHHDLMKNNNILIFSKNIYNNLDLSNSPSSSHEINNNQNKPRAKSKSLVHKDFSSKKKKSKVYYPPKKNSLATDVILNKKKHSKKKSRMTINYQNKLSDKKLLENNKIHSTYKFSEINLENQSKENKDLNIKNEGIEPKEKLDNFELNNLEYDLAIKLDKRDFLETYWSILKREHLIFFTFFVRNDYNIIYVKFSRFIFLVCTDMALNVFFFADETMHKMLLDYGKYNFVQQIPQIIYSTIVSQLIEVFLCFLSMTDKHFYEIKNLDAESRNKMFNIIKCIKIKILFFYLFTFIMFLFYWYVIACFCAVYENTQPAFIKDSLSSFGLGLLYPFVLYLFPAALRIIALRVTKIRLSWVYSISDIIPIF